MGFGLRYYDLYGMPISMQRWSQLHGEYKHVGSTVVRREGQSWWVSTVWLGLDHGFGSGPPVIFETMTFGADGSADVCARYSTLRQAQHGHREVVRELRRMKRQSKQLISHGKKP